MRSSQQWPSSSAERERASGRSTWPWRSRARLRAPLLVGLGLKLIIESQEDGQETDLTGEHVDGEALVVADGREDGDVWEVFPESAGRHLDTLHIVPLALAPDVVCREVPGEDDVVQLVVGELDVPESGVQGPGRGVTGVVAPVSSRAVGCEGEI